MTESGARRGSDAVFERRLAQVSRRGAAITPRSRDGLLLPSFGQERLWLLDQIEPGTTTNTLAFAVRLTGHLDRDAFGRATAEIVRRHDVLRSSFVDVDGVPRVVVGSPRVPLRLVDASGKKSIGRLLEKAAGTVFDPAKPPLLELTLLRVDADEHVLIVAVHHSCWDAWSTRIFFAELAALYPTYAAGRRPRLPDLTLQYSDFAAWQRERLHGERLRRQLQFWRRTLAGAPQALELPADRARPAEPTWRAGHVRRFIPERLAGALRAKAAEAGATQFVALLAIFSALLARVARQDDVVIGTYATHRAHVELEPLIGFFANTLALRIRCDGSRTFVEMLRRARATVAAAQAHSEVPVELVLDELRPERRTNRSPVFQTMLVLEQRTPGGRVELPGLLTEPLRVAPERTNFDLTLWANPRGDRLELDFEYSRDLFDEPRVERLALAFEQMVESAIRDSRAPLSAAAITEPNERDRAPRRRVRALAHELVERQADRTPAAPAVRDSRGVELTYRALDERANRLARHLAATGVGPESVVAVCVERSVEFAVAVLGVLKAGGAYLPLDPAYPADRNRQVLSDAGATALLTLSRLLDELPPFEGSMILLDGDAISIQCHSHERASVRVRSSALAYVIYTSGSTGQPKGVEMPHSVLANLLHSHVASGFGGARVLQLAPFTFDVAFQEMFTTWTTGGVLVIADEEERLDPARLWRRIRAERVQRVFATPTALGLLARASDATTGDVAIEELVAAGEQLVVDRPLADLLRRAGATLANHYGPSETHVVSSFTVDGVPDAPTAVPIGRAIEGVRLHVLDDELAPQPVGVPGELYIGGAAPARGYRRRPALTAERFVPDPFSRDPGARLYRSGDLARLASDGSLEFLGRVDEQVKLRGFRIELGEVEAVLGEHPAVDAAAAAVRDVAGRRTLVGYVVTPSLADNAGDLRTWLARRLPTHMVPTHVVSLDALPLTPSGKVDRRALPAPPQAPRPASAAVATTAAETTLAEIWARLLGVEAVGVDDDFFELGGDSLVATHVAAHAADLGLPLSPLDIFRERTISAIYAAREARGVARVAGPQRPVVGVSMHGLVEGQVDRRPAALAVRDGVDGGLSFAGLEERANRLAWVLRARGSGRSRLWCVCGTVDGLGGGVVGGVEGGCCISAVGSRSTAGAVAVDGEGCPRAGRGVRGRVPGGVWLRRAAGGGQPYWRGALSA